MHPTLRHRSPFAVLAALFALVVFATPASASHSWGNYHWARTANPFTIKVVDSMTADWDDNLNTALADWNSSSVLNVAKEAGDSSSRIRKRCPAISGKVRACNAAYGNNGWLGLAQIWASGSHITQGTAKMNDSYLASSSYSETNRQHVICQEIGHDWGLDHQDESGADLNTCMDYSDALDNPHPNQHDYAQLESIYAHLDSTTTIASMPASVANADLSAPAQWGKLVKGAGARGVSIYVRDFGGGNRVITFVTWAR
jgi:hypothetical protein